jgi:hypothetical protein
LAVNKNLFLQGAISAGTETLPWRLGTTISNPFPNQLYPGQTFKQDPGAQPSFSACVRYQSDSANDNIYLCANGINDGEFGYNNLQWFGGTYYHKFNDAWHISVEVYNEHQNNVPNLLNPTVQNIAANGGTPFSTAQTPFNAPSFAQCSNAAVLKCKAEATGALFYLNYQFAPLDNLSLRGEYYDDAQGQRTGTVAQYKEVGLGWQHWIGPQIELRPEVTYYLANAPAFNGNSNHGIAPNMKHILVWAGDVIVHF